MSYDADDLDECLTLLSTIRCFASTGDKSAFEVLPPILMNDSEIITGQQLWGGFCADRTDSSYMCAPLPSLSGSVLIGACILPFQSIGYPVLIFETKSSKKISAIVYGIRTSSLECDFYKQRDSATEIEKRWKGVELAESQAMLLHMVGEYSKSFGIEGVPNYLIDKENGGSNLHLVRKGPIPFLHMRSAIGKTETSMIHRVVRCRISDPQHEKINAISSFDDLIKHLTDMEAPSEYSFETYFTSEIRLRDDPLEDGSSEELAKTLATIPSIVHPMFAMVASGPVHDAMARLKKMSEEFSSNQDAKSSKRVTTDVKGNLLSDLISSSPWLHTVENIGNLGGIAQAFCVASCIFEPRHVGMAIRDIVHDTDQSKPILTAKTIVYNLAKRVQNPGCVMCIDLSASREVKTIRLVNSNVDYEIDVDCAGRLLDCRWIHPIGVLQSGKESGNFFALTCKHVSRPKLQVCASISEGYNSEREHVVRSPQFDFTSIDKRISKVETLLSDLKKHAESNVQKRKQPEPNSLQAVDGLSKLATANESWQSNKRDRAGEKPLK